MKKLLTLLFVLLALTQAITDKEIIQQGLNGLFEENKLPDPTTIVDCIDDDSAHKIVVFGGEMLAKAASGSLSDYIQIISLMKDFVDQIPKPVSSCLYKNPEVATVALKYGIDGTTDVTTIEKKIITYATLHFLEMHKEAVLLNGYYIAGKFYEVGYEGGAYWHKVLVAPQDIPNLTDKEIIQAGLNGLFEQNKLPDPTTIVPCFDDATAHKIVVFAGEVLEKAAKGSITDLVQLISLIKGFGDQIPQSVKDCLNGNKELETLGLKYGITPTTDTSALEKKVITYVTLHYLEVHKWFGDLNNNWKAGKYYQVGFDGAGYGHKILGLSEDIPNYADKDIIQRSLNGIFGQNNLDEPTTIVPCIDDATAHKIVIFAGEVIDKASRGSIVDLVQIISLIKGFGSQIPQPVKDCLNGNKELEALQLAYGITPTTDTSVLEKKIVSYFTLHYLQVHNWLGHIHDNWHANAFQQVGYDSAGYLHRMLAITLQEIIKIRNIQ